MGPSSAAGEVWKMVFRTVGPELVDMARSWPDPSSVQRFGRRVVRNSGGGPAGFSLALVVSPA